MASDDDKNTINIVQSVHDYQTPSICGDCGGNRDVHDYCIDCKANICNGCKDKVLHQQHKVQNRASQEVRNAIALQNNPCKDHPGNEFVSFCDRCQDPCCAVCITDSHNGHTFISLDRAANNAKSKIEAYIKTETEETIPHLQKKQNVVLEGIEKYNKSMQKTIDISRECFQTLRNDLDRVEKDWFEKLENMKADENKTMITLEGSLDSELKRRKERTDICRSTISGGSNLTLLTLCSDLQDEQNVKVTEMRLPQSIDIKLSGYKLPDVKELIGETVQTSSSKISDKVESVGCKLPQDNDHIEITTKEQSKISNNADQSEYKPFENEALTGETVRKPGSKISPSLPRTVNTWKLWVLICSVHVFLSVLSVMLQNIYFQTFDTDMKEVRTLKTIQDRGAAGIVHTREDDVWAYSRHESSTLSLYSYNLDLRDEIQVDFRIGYIVVSSTEDKLATDWNGQRVVSISSEDEIETLLDTAPWRPFGLCINDRKEIVLALRTGKTSSLVTYSMIASTELRKIKEVATFSDFSIFAVQQNGNGDYIASGYEGVICVTRDGTYRWKYDTIDSDIESVVCDRHDNIIIAEYATNKITMLGSDGKLIKTLMTADDGIWRPLALSIDSKGHLWIGQKRNIKIVQYIK